MLTPLPNNHYIVELPEDASDVFIGLFSGGLCYRGGDNFPAQNIIELNGRFKIAFTRDTQTEEGWKEVVEMDEFYCAADMNLSDFNYIPEWHYVNYLFNHEPYFYTATQSGHSLLESLEVKGNWVIIKKQ